MSSAKSNYYYKLFRVRRSDGRVTTVSMDPALVTRACQVMGGLRPVGKLVRETALTYEDGMGKNCSGFVAQTLVAKLKAQLAPRTEAVAEMAA